MNTNKVELHEEIILGMHELYMRKNNDYGDSFEKVRAKFPEAILIRLNDKLSRLETLMQGKTQLVLDESVTDCLTDLANYCILELIERKIDEQYLEQYRANLLAKDNQTISE